MTTAQQQKEKLMFEKKKIKDQADTIAEQTKRIEEFLKKQQNENNWNPFRNCGNCLIFCRTVLCWART